MSIQAPGDRAIDAVRVEQELHARLGIDMLKDVARAVVPVGARCAVVLLVRMGGDDDVAGTPYEVDAPPIVGDHVRFGQEARLSVGALEADTVAIVSIGVGVIQDRVVDIATADRRAGLEVEPV